MTNLASIYLDVHPMTLGTNVSMLLEAQCRASLPLNVMKAAILPHEIPVDPNRNRHSLS